jgi:hypothetical protein
MSFWLEDDDDPYYTGGSQQPSASQQTVYMSQQERQFSCDNCGGTDCYHDDSTGRDVCSACFTQSQAVSQAEADWEDVVGLAARTAGGQIQQRRVTSKRKRGDTGRTKQPLQELDRSVPLPDTAICLKGMQRVLQQCVHIAVTELLPNEPEIVQERKSRYDDSDDDFDEAQRQDEPSDLVSRQLQRTVAIENTMKELWLSYLRAWADGAEFYGTMHPHVRFCFRDYFLGNHQANQLLRHHLVHQVVEAEAVAADSDHEDAVPPDNKKSSASRKHERSLEESSSDEEDTGSATEDEGMPDVEIATEPNVGSRGRRTYPNKIRALAIREVIQAHTSFRRKGYKEAALYIRPSMTMVAAFVWLALTKHKGGGSATVVTSHDVCRWIATGKLPLMAAFQNLLTRRLQHRLAPVAAFFRLEKPLDPSELEIMATNLCAACRFLIHPKRESDIDDDSSSSTEEAATGKQAPPESAVVVKLGNQPVIRFWSLSSLPRVMAQLVANAGLEQAVLDRTLIMAGFVLEDPSITMQKKPSMHSAYDNSATGSKKGSTKVVDEVVSTTDPTKLPVVVQAEQLARIDELLALIAIACQLDPQWRTWKYCRPKEPSPAVPWNESQFRLLSNGQALNSYLDFVEQHVFPDGDDDAIDEKNNRLSLLPQEYFDAVGSLPNERKLYKDAAVVVGNDDSSEAPKHLDVTVRPCLLLAGGQAPTEVEVTNLTHRRPPNHIEVWHRQGKPKKPKKAPSEARRRNKKLDEMLLLPFHDFQRADRAASDWIPDNCPDAHQDRLIQFLAFTANVDPESVRRTMFRMLDHRKL